MEEQNIYLFRRELQNLGYSKSAVTRYPSDVRKFLDHVQKPLQEIVPEDMEHYYQLLQNTKISYSGKLLKPTGISSILSSLRTYFVYLQRTGEIENNPYQLNIKLFKSEERKVFTENQIQVLYRKSDKRQTLILHLCYACGLRRAEASEISPKDIDVENGLLYVRKGKGRKRRAIPFTRQVGRAIEDFIFSSENEKRRSTQNQESLLGINVTSIDVEFRKLLKKADLYDQGFTLHCLRHTIATHLLDRGMEMEKVRDFLGHDYLRTTQIYTHIKLED